ncbi:EAL domain-containing protein [Sinorhizobium sp. BJ1]|uniref:EAL domain-containing protein n=1 Tax=Sinorhizobium sp. BJ1 TaxID=2035455 RepID=UPI000BE80F8E|nr:EAL domain-containing protein [Sinorhizobium sp. BJ1]PDT80139.1 histidine kinase [Sinorhizobium sp. BJ1]
MKLETRDDALGSAARAMRHGRIGFSLQQVNAVNDSSEVLYSECLGRFVEPDGTVRTRGEFSALPEAAAVDRVFGLDLLDLAFEWLACHPLDVLGCDISAENMADERSCMVLHDLFSRHSALATRMVLEVTENLPLKTLPVAADLLKSARSIGYRIAIDKFGTGNALSIPADLVKIDACFPQHSRGDAAPILRDMVALASYAVSIVVVEGIETYDQLEAARSAGATHVQGFLLSEPTLPPIYSRSAKAFERRHRPLSHGAHFAQRSWRL